MSLWTHPNSGNVGNNLLSRLRRPRPAKADLDALLARIRHRLYPESVPVLASYWLRTIYCSGHNLAWWHELNAEMEVVVREGRLDGGALECLKTMQAWIQRAILRSHKAPRRREQLRPPFRANLTPEQAKPYLCRLLNEWAPAEIARLLMEGTGLPMPEDGGIPVPAVGIAIERLLTREHVSAESLETLLQPALLSPRQIYPFDAEIFRDVALALLGRTWSPPPPATPAALLGAAAGTTLPDDYAEAVESAFLVARDDGDELHVPVAEAQAAEILRSDPLRIGSIVATMDGRWWEAENLQRGAENVVVYRPGGRLRIDFTSDHARLAVPWPDTEAYWPGSVRLPESIRIFGREWRARAWERNAERTWLHLEFSRALQAADTDADVDTRSRRLRPASAEMAWSEMEEMLTSCILERNSAPMDQLRRGDLIPLGHAIYALADSLEKGVLRTEEEMERRLMAIRYLHGCVSAVYGRIPWRVAPAAVRGAFLKRRVDARSKELLGQIFDDLPAALRGHATSPPQAA